MSNKIRLQGYIIVKDEILASVLQELPRHIELTRAEEGCIEFRVKQNPLDRHKFHVYEEFESRAAFELHQERVRNSRWGKATTAAERHYSIEVF